MSRSSRFSLRVALAALGAVTLLPMSALTAQAAVPANDLPSGATVITALPTTINQNTVGATTDAVDAALNCGAPATNGSVWFRYTATDNGGLLVDGTASNYGVGFFITAGDPTTGEELACAPDVAAVATTAGQTYYVVAFSDTVGVMGGNLSVTFSVAPPPPTIDSITVNPKGVAFKDGSAQISGTLNCTGADYVDLFGQVIQKVGRTKIVGDFYTPAGCDGTTQAWSAYATSQNGYFAGGKAATVAIALACNVVQCTDGYVEQIVQLSRSAR